MWPDATITCGPVSLVGGEGTGSALGCASVRFARGRGLGFAFCGAGVVEFSERKVSRTELGVGDGRWGPTTSSGVGMDVSLEVVPVVALFDFRF